MRLAAVENFDWQLSSRPLMAVSRYNPLKAAWNIEDGNWFFRKSGLIGGTPKRASASLRTGLVAVTSVTIARLTRC
jgi:hypothetical protein